MQETLPRTPHLPAKERPKGQEKDLLQDSSAKEQAFTSVWLILRTQLATVLSNAASALTLRVRLTTWEGTAPTSLETCIDGCLQPKRGLLAIRIKAGTRSVLHSMSVLEENIWSNCIVSDGFSNASNTWEQDKADLTKRRSMDRIEQS